MFIDSDNFEEQKQKILQQIKAADLLAFDLELTGIKGDYQDTYEELPFERYLKVRKVSMKYNIIQFGLCVFIKNNNKYQGYPYTFYIFPQDLDDVVGLQVGAVFFNSEHGMDWNRWINKGIGYLNKAQYQRVQEDFNKEQQQYDQEELRAQFQKLMSEVKPFDAKKITELVDKIKIFNDSQEKQLFVETTNPYQRKLVYTYIDAYCKNMIGETQIKGMKLTKLSDGEKQAKEEEKQQLKVYRFQNRIGFNVIWDAIQSSKKPLIGHNCFADIMFTYSHFTQCPPISWEEFKEEIVKFWPPIYDTKYIISCSKQLEKLRSKLPDTSTSVESLVDFIKANNQVVQIDAEIGENQYHTAGFDAFKTGFIFLNLTQDFSKQDLQEQSNKIFQFKSNYNINLNTPEDLKQSEANLLYLRLPEEDKKQQLYQKNQRQMQQKQLLECVINKLKSLNENILSSRIIHFRYIYLEFEQNADVKYLTQQLIKLHELAECQVLTEKQYEKERREMKEKDAKMEKFDRR